MCFKKRNDNKPVRLAKKSSPFDDLKQWSTPEVWTIVGFIIVFILLIFLALLNRSAFWYNVPL